MRRPCNLLLTMALMIALMTSGVSVLSAQADPPPCGDPVRWLWRPQNMCAEVIFQIPPVPGQMTLGAITFTPDGSLVFTLPAARQVMRLPFDPQGRTGTAMLIAQDLPEAPVGITFDPSDPSGETFYLSADTLIMRLTAAGQSTVIVRDLPGGAGRWLGNIRIGADGRLYVAKGSGCESCAEDDPRRAALLSFAPDGSDMQIVAKGLRDSFDFLWHEGVLYIGDHERPDQPAELNRLDAPGADFGYPACAGTNQPTLPGVICEDKTPPLVIFASDSHPTGMVYYDHDLYPELRGKLLVALSGSWNAVEVGGYEISAVDLSSGTTERFLPQVNRSSSDASLIRASFYPYHLTGLAVDERGWIYAGVAEGRIYRFRPFPGR